MRLEDLKYERKIWNADENEHFLSSISPSSVLSQGYFHEFYHESAAKVPVCPILGVVPSIKKLPSFNKLRLNNQYIVFLGKESWPTPFCLRDVFEDTPLSSFLFIHSPSGKSHLRALEILTSSANVFAVVTKLSKVSFQFTQRLFLRSKQSNTQLLVFRDSKEIYSKSAAFSKWSISPAISNTNYPSWQLNLKHSKGSLRQNNWLLKGVNEKEISVHLLSELVSRSRSENLANVRFA